MQGTYSARLAPVWLLRIVALESRTVIKPVSARCIVNLLNTPPTDILIKRLSPVEHPRHIFNPRKKPRADYEPPLEQGNDKYVVGNRKEVALESHRLEIGIANLIAFVYEGLSRRENADVWSFEKLLQNAMHRVERRNNWVLESYHFEADFDKSGQRLEEVHTKFKNGQATMNEATLLLQQGVISDEKFTEYAQKYNQ